MAADRKGVLHEHPLSERRPAWPVVRKVCVIEDISHDELQPLLAKRNVEAQPVTRGFLVTGKRCSDVAIDAACDLGKRAYSVRVFPFERKLTGTLYDGPVSEVEFTSAPRVPREHHAVLDTILGDGSVRGILRALEIPFELVGLTADGSFPSD